MNKYAVFINLGGMCFAIHIECWPGNDWSVGTALAQSLGGTLAYTEPR